MTERRTLPSLPLLGEKSTSLINTSIRSYEGNSRLHTVTDNFRISGRNGCASLYLIACPFFLSFFRQFVSLCGQPFLDYSQIALSLFRSPEFSSLFCNRRNYFYLFAQSFVIKEFVRIFLLERENGGGRQIYFEIARVCIGTRSSFGRLFLAREVCVEVFLRQRNFEIFLSKICDLIIGETSFSPPDFSRSGVSPPVSFGGCKLTFITDASEARLSSIGCATTTTIASTVTFQRGGVPGKRGKRARTSLRFRESGSP